MQALRVLALAALLGPLSQLAHAWGNHSLASYRAFEVMPEVTQATPVVAESLESFLRAEETTLEALLASQEAWAAANLPHYPTRPAALAFKADAGRTDAARRMAFLSALRVAPNTKFALFVQPDLRTAAPAGPKQPFDAVSTLTHSDHATQVFVGLRPGDRVSALAVLASATDEPDYGLDINLWDDSPSTWGRTYGFGKQPFGNPSLAISSQAPFHMGFHHESALLYLAAPFLKRTFPTWRYYQWSSLAGLAFRTDHPYWGWRFAGMALHYLQDLTQPFHARLAPGESDGRLLLANTLALAGLRGMKDDLVVLLSNRHLALERYQTSWLAESAQAQRSNALDDALHSTSVDGVQSNWNAQSLRDTVAVQAAGSADALAGILLRHLPARYVSDPNFDFGAQGDAVNLMAEVRLHAPASATALEVAIADLLGKLGVHSRNALRAILKNAPQANVREN